MTIRQRLEIRMSKLRTRLREIASLSHEDFTSEVRAEAEQLETEINATEVQYRASIIAEGAEEAAALGIYPDGSHSDGAELRQLLGRVTLADYVQPALAGVGITGAARELADALEVPAMGKGGGVAVPWRILEEDRAFTTTTQNDGPESQRPILQRLFGPGIMDQLGVRMDTVPVGRTEWPLSPVGLHPTKRKKKPLPPPR